VRGEVGLARVIRKAAPLVLAAGAAAYLRRQRALSEGAPQLTRSPEPVEPSVPGAPAPPEPEPTDVVEAGPPRPEPEASLEVEPEPDDGKTVEFERVEESPPADAPDSPAADESELLAGPDPVADVTAIVDDLLSAQPASDEPISDAEVVEQEDDQRSASASMDAAVGEAVRAAVDDHPAVPKGAVGVQVAGGTVYLRGALERRETIAELGRKAAGVSGVRAVHNLVHLRESPPAGA
jgi:hypothetical protein